MKFPFIHWYVILQPKVEYLIYPSECFFGIKTEIRNFDKYPTLMCDLRRSLKHVPIDSTTNNPAYYKVGCTAKLIPLCLHANPRPVAPEADTLTTNSPETVAATGHHLVTTYQ